MGNSVRVGDLFEEALKYEAGLSGPRDRGGRVPVSVTPRALSVTDEAEEGVSVTARTQRRAYCQHPDCGKSMLVTRSDAKFCSGRCRTRAYRNRQRARTS